MDAVTRHPDRIKREPEAAAPATRTLDSTMADPAENDVKSTVAPAGSKGVSPTELMTEQLEATVRYLEITPES